MKIAIMGSAPSSRTMAPFQDPAWEVWCCSPPNYDSPRVDAWFELHNLDRKFSVQQNGPYLEVITRHPRVYITKPDARLPNGLLFDWKPLVHKYGNYFFTSSIAWMMAAALELKPDKIGLWGIDMSATEEYGYQRAGLHYFIQKAEEAGTAVFAPGTSDIKQGVPLYAIKEHWPMWQKYNARKNELRDRLNQAEDCIQKASKDQAVLKGALDDMQYNENTWLQPDWIEETFPRVTVDKEPENTD